MWLGSGYLRDLAGPAGLAKEQQDLVEVEAKFPLGQLVAPGVDFSGPEERVIDNQQTAKS